MTSQLFHFPISRSHDFDVGKNQILSHPILIRRHTLFYWQIFLLIFNGLKVKNDKNLAQMLS
jgi:hypothetical protein